MKYTVYINDEVLKDIMNIDMPLRWKLQIIMSKIFANPGINETIPIEIIIPGIDQ